MQVIQLHRDKDFYFYMNNVYGINHIHLTFYKFTPTTYKKFIKVFNTKMSFLKSIGFKEIYAASPNIRFCSRFVDLIDIVKDSGKDIGVFKWVR